MGQNLCRESGHCVPRPVSAGDTLNADRKSTVIQVCTEKELTVFDVCVRRVATVCLDLQKQSTYCLPSPRPEEYILYARRALGKHPLCASLILLEESLLCSMSNTENSMSAHVV